MYKIIAVDFDGTILNDKKKITNQTKKILKKCKNKNHKIVAVTARNFKSATSVVPLKLFDYFLLNNGAYLYDVEKKEGKHYGKITKKLYKAIVDEIEKEVREINFISENNYYIYKRKRNSKQDFIKNLEKIEDINEEIIRMNIMLNNQEKVGYYNELINKKYKEINCIIMQDSGDITKRLIINPKGINKLTGLKNLIKELNITLEEIMFFGDGLNDLEIIKNVGCGVAMENALDEVKKNAKEITLSNNDNGVAKYLEKYIKNM